MVERTVTQPRSGTSPRRRARPILVVDDDPAVRELVTAVLVEAGYEVVTADDGAEALRVVSDVPPRLLLLDIQMPNVDGPSLARELRAQLRELPVVVMTARPDPKREADRCNAVAFLPKPFDTERLVSVVRRFAR